MRFASMKKLICLSAVLIICVTNQTGFSQTWDAVLTVDPYPSPFLSDWQTDPTMATLEITNPTAKPDVIIVDLEMSCNSGARFRGSSQRMLVNAEQTISMNSTEFNAWYTQELDQSVKDKATRTGMMPEGSYQACITVRNLWGIVLAHNVCAYVTIAHAEPPELIYPINSQVVSNPYPVFQWIPPQLPSAKQMVFVLRMVKVLPGQTPEMALSANYPHYENFNLFESNMEYPLDAQALEPNATFVWQVQALDFEGKPVTKNDGRSVLGIFSTSSSLEGLAAELQLVAPENQTNVTTFPVEFQWNEPDNLMSGPLHYEIRIAEIKTGQTPQQALQQNIPVYLYAEIIGQTSWLYPNDAPAFVSAKSYAWQIRATDEFGNPASGNDGLSAAWTFTVGPVVEQPTRVLPERLALVGESVAYLELAQNGKPLVNYRFTADSASMVVNGPMTLVVPALQTGACRPRLTVEGELKFNSNTLIIESGAIQGDAPQNEPCFNLGSAGVPLVLTQFLFSASEPDRIECQAVPIVFGRVANNATLTASIQADGSLHSDVSTLLTESIPLVANSSKIVLESKKLEGTINASLSSGVINNKLLLEADLLVSGASQSARFPVELQLSKDGAEMPDMIATQQSLEIDLGALLLDLTKMRCQMLRYSQSSQTWLFDLAFDLEMNFNELGVALPTVPDVHMSRLGIEIPQISVPDLGMQEKQLYADLWITPRAFRMYPYTFNWHRWNAGDIGDWGFFWDVDIQLPYLPQHLTSLDQTPFRANNVTYVNAALKGAWNTRTFAPALFVPLADSVSWGLAIQEIKGNFSQSGATIGVKAKWIPPDEMNLNSQESIVFSTDQLALSPRGIFSGQIPSLTLANAIQWGSALSITAKSAGLNLAGANNRQTASLRVNGAVTIPSHAASTLEAIGEGVFDLFTWQLVSGQFLVANGFTLDLPWSDRLFGFVCQPGAKLDAQGLHVAIGANDILLADEEKVPNQTNGELLIALPDWTLLCGTVQFTKTFGLALSNLYSGKGGKWQTLSSTGDVQSEADNLFMVLPNLPRLDADMLVASGNSKAALQFKGTRYQLDATFSNDFLFGLTPPAVRRGSVQFSIANQNVAKLDSNGLNLGEYFGVTLSSAKIGLPDTSIAYLDMTANPNLTLANENGLKRIKSTAFQNAVIHFPSLRYQAGAIPTIQAQVNLLVDPSSNCLSSGSVHAVGQPLLSLVTGQVPLEMIQADLNSGKWTASVRPVLPMALRANSLMAYDIPINANGLTTFNTGFNEFQGAPRDSVHLGEYLRVTLDGFQCITGGTLPKVSFSGDFKSPVFSGQRIHFSSKLNPDSAAFVIKSMNVELPFGCGILELADEGDQHHVQAPFNQQELVLALNGVLKLESLSPGCALTCQRLEIRGNSISLKQTIGESTAQSLALFGSQVMVKKFTLNFTMPDSFDIALNGSMKLFNTSIDFSGLHIPNGCMVADGTIADYPSGLKLNKLLTLRSLKTNSSNLTVALQLLRPNPFTGSQKDSLSLTINPLGQWLDSEGKLLTERKWKIDTENSGQTPRAVLGDDKTLTINAYLTAITIALDGQNNTGGTGSIDYQVDTFWPTSGAVGAADSACVRTHGLFQFDAATVTEAWLLSQDTTVDTVSAVLSGNLYLHAADFQMADTTAYQMRFNCLMQLPLPSDVINGQVELVDNRLEPGLFKLGKVHSALVKVPGFTLELLDLHWAKNTNVELKDIEVSGVKASLASTTVFAETFLSFGANLYTDLPGFQFGIERFIVFNNKEQFHLVLQHAIAWVGEYLYFDLDLIGQIWHGDKTAGKKTTFKWLVGGNMDIKAGQFQGGAVVGEISFRETVNVNGQTENLPGFGIFSLVKFDVKLYPIPLTLTGLGIGWFFNPSKETQEMVYYHVMGYDERTNKEMREEFQAVMDATQDDMMTVGVVYLYGSGAVPDKSGLEGQVLLTLATDRIGLNAKIAPAEDTEIAKVVDLSGWIQAECAWKQDFSSFKYLAGHLKIGGRGVQDQVPLLKLPETAQAQLDFIITNNGNFAIAGRMTVEPLSSYYLTASCDFTFGPIGFVFDGSVGFGYNIYILRIESGLEIRTYLKWTKPVKFGISANCYVEGCFIDDWLASFRGEMGAALVVKPDLFLYGYAELTGTFLGISKTLKVWAKWEEGGDTSSGTGEDPTMEEFIAEAQSVADEIMSSLLELKAELGMLDVLQYGGMTEEEVKKIIALVSTDTYDRFIEILYRQDFNDLQTAVTKEVSELKDFQKEISEKVNTFIQDVNNLLTALSGKGFSPLLADIKKIEPVLTQTRTAMQSRVTDAQTASAQLVGNLSAIDFALDTTLVLTDIEPSPIKNPLTISYTYVEGIPVPDIQLDETIDEQNTANINKLRQAMEGWLAKVNANMQKIRQGRRQLYALLGPGGPLSATQIKMIGPMLSANADFNAAIKEFSNSFNSCYSLYNSIPRPFYSDEVFQLAAQNARHRRDSNELRESTLKALEIDVSGLPVNDIDRYRALGNIFYRKLPQVVLCYYLKQADSLITAFCQYTTDLQASLDKIHQSLTFNTDFVWNKYAELSEKSLAMLDMYQSTRNSMATGSNQPAQVDSMAIYLTELKNEFNYPTLNPQTSVSQPSGFNPITVTMDYQSGSPADVAEYAVSLDNNAFQSMGNLQQWKRDYMLKPGVSYWMEVDGGMAEPIAVAEKRWARMAPRIRNKAGLTSSSGSAVVEMKGNTWQSSISVDPAPNTVTPTMKPDSMYRCLVHWPYPSAQRAEGTVFFCNERNELKLRWTLKSNYGISGENPVPAKHRIELLRGGKTIFGPEFVPVTQNSLSDTFSITLTGIDLTANTGEPYEVSIQEYDLTDVLIGTSSGKQIVYTRNDDGSLKPWEQTWNAPPLYIDTTPPIITGEAQHIDIGSERFVIYRLPKAKDEVKIGSGAYSEWLSGAEAYEYKLLSQHESAEASEWITLKYSNLVMLPRSTTYHQDLYTLYDPNSGAYFLNFGSRAFADSLQFIVRGRNEKHFWDTGFSPATTFIIPKANESKAPQPASFKILGLNQNKDIEISIVEPGSDGLSGVSHYPWRLHQNLYRSSNPVVTVWQPNLLRFPADSVRAGAVLVIPIPHDSIDVNNSVTIELVTVDHCGNQASSQQEFQPGPPSPDLTAQLLPGFSPFSIQISGALAPLSENYIDSLRIYIGTAPDAYDVLSLKKSFTELYRLGNGSIFTWTIELPATITEGTSLYLSAQCIRQNMASAAYTKRIQIYQPMFESVETDADGYLVLPITQNAFHGQREANFKWAVGYYAPTLSAQNRYQLNIQPLTALTGVSGEQIVSGTRIRLPIQAAQVRPISLIVLQATALDGEIHATYREAAIVPPKPEIKANLTMDRDYDRYFYRLDVQTKFGGPLQISSGTAGQAQVLLKLGSAAGMSDIQNATIPLVSGSSDGFTTQSIFLDSTLARYERLYVTAFSRTSMGTKSGDSTTLVLDIPWPVFWKTPQITFAGNISVIPLRRGFSDAGKILGYQWAVGDGEGSTFDLRPYPANAPTVDIAVDDWSLGKIVTLPFSIQGRTNKTFRVGIRVILNDGRTHEQIEITKPFLQPQVHASVIGEIPQLKLVVQGDLGPEMVTQIYLKELRIELSLNGTSYFFQTFTVPDNGVVDKTLTLPTMPPCAVYQFKSFFWHMQSQQFASYTTDVDMPCYPMFTTVAADSQDMIYVDMLRNAFDGQREVQGYQFALGTRLGVYDVRAFASQYDITPEKVRPGQRLVLPASLAGVPATCWLALQGIDAQGKTHKTEQSFQARPVRPKVISLRMDSQGRFTVQFDRTCFDAKVKSMDCWIISAQDNDHVIAFQQREAAELQTGVITIESSFSTADIGKEFILAGNSIGYQINSLEFQYRFRIEKSGEEYRIVPMP